MCTYNMCPFNKRVFFTIKQVFYKLFKFKCNEHVEMNKFLCSLASTWMTIIDSQFFIIDSLFHWFEMLTWWLPGCKHIIKTFLQTTVK